eukprot:TRINITY_DN1142_c0_g1_i1.p1 TRINITY_DN1142_c0_g1~~TRINITY_DN1142_c0_g1_i1.p1  ORF type:complete len:198 (-),score=33.52 TRINITY_DN1142_c0_g1_i1:167-760(-)
MKYFRRWLLIPSIVAVILLEFFWFASLVLWIVGWAYGQRIQSYNHYNGLWDDNGPAIFYYVLNIVLILVAMLLLPVTLIPFWKGYVSRWSSSALFPIVLWIIALSTNTLYGTIRFISVQCQDAYNFRADYTRYCRGSKLIFSSSFLLIFVGGLTAGYLIWLLQETIFQGIRKVHKRGKQRDAKLATVRPGETVTAAY